ncbi:MAG: hypothetical protein A2749_02415 [Parcubacteria group bacterium RIFCSPHIGHO2_01_FULL_45_26]|nr:MAG: hypothetical protein A2749_02415 [Parcubacteria group bacterium RIFCSPHIGHO2_01_FULL_45_26]
MRATVVIPTYNEVANIAKLIERILGVAPNMNILVVDDNSPDATGTVVSRIAQINTNVNLLSRDKKEGLGPAYVAGFKKVTSDDKFTHIVMMDADFSHNPSALPAMLEKAKYHDVVVGSRYVRGGATEGWEFWRRILSWGGNLYARTITGLPVHDCTGGFNVINVKKLRQIDFDRMDASGYAFILELKFMLAKAGATFVEVPILFRNRTGGESKMSSHIIREGILAPWKMRFLN